jgi:4-hydroxyphenylpyruvate dioxygenase
MTLVAKSDHSTGNSKYCSYVLQSNELVFTFTAPYSLKCCAAAPSSKEPLPDYDQQQAFEFICTHGMAVRAVGKHLNPDSHSDAPASKHAAGCLNKV